MNWRVFFFLLSAVIGSGAFILPFTLSFFGPISVLSFLLTSIIVILLSYFFSKITSISQIIDSAFGKSLATVCTYFYWLIGSISTIVVINEIIIYLSVLFPVLESFPISSALLLLAFFTLLNCLSNKYSTLLEGFFTVIKILVLILLPIMILINVPSGPSLPKFHFNLLNLFKSIGLSMWSFVGIETISSISLEKYRIQFTSIFSVILICLLYLLNILVIFYKFGFTLSARPYVDIASQLGYSATLSIIIGIICIGTLNSWISSSGFFAYQAAQHKLMPSLFSRTYNNVPYLSIIISSAIIIPFIFLLKYGLSHIMILLLDISCNGLFLFYGIICFSYVKMFKNVIATLLGCICCCIGVLNLLCFFNII